MKGGLVMRKIKTLLTLLFLSLFLLTSCSDVPLSVESTPGIPPPPYVSEPDMGEAPIEAYNEEPISPFVHIPHGELALQYIFFLNDYLPERIAFSYRELDAAAWIVEELLAMGYAESQIEVQTFTRKEASLSSRARDPLHFFPIGGHTLRPYSQNVILTVPGQSEHTIIVGAHYDSLLYPGASDNASGVALLLESAARMRYLDSYYTIVYIFFGAEEVWWVGAYVYLDRLSEPDADNIILMVNADVLLDGDTLIYAAGYGTNRQSPRPNTMTAEIDQIAARLQGRYDMALTSRPHGLAINTDHAAFFYAGHTVLFLFGANYVNGQFHLDILHSPQDDIHWLNEHRPGRAEQAMWVFSVFLEEILLLGPVPR